jgi:hypothetical protein
LADIRNSRNERGSRHCEDLFLKRTYPKTLESLGIVFLLTDGCTEAKEMQKLVENYHSIGKDLIFTKEEESLTSCFLLIREDLISYLESL